jgi:hypothetical protein
VQKRFLGTMLALLGTSCGSDSGSNTTGEPPSSGLYSFTTSDLATTCSDGTGGTNPKFAMNVSVTLTGNQIKITAPDGDQTSQEKVESAGFKINASGYSGILNKDNTFVATQTGSGSSDQFGALVATYALDGKFKAEKWSGSFKYNIVFTEKNASCEYKATFEGTRQK